MNKSIIFVAAAIACGVAHADKYTRGYVRQDGTVVQGHYSTNANGTRLDNYSTQGNVNPYTGKPGAVNPYIDPGSVAQQPRSSTYGTPQQPLTAPDPYGLRNSRKF